MEILNNICRTDNKIQKKKKYVYTYIYTPHAI